MSDAECLYYAACGATYMVAAGSNYLFDDVTLPDFRVQTDRLEIYLGDISGWLLDEHIQRNNQKYLFNHDILTDDIGDDLEVTGGAAIRAAADHVAMRHPSLAAAYWRYAFYCGWVHTTLDAYRRVLSEVEAAAPTLYQHYQEKAHLVSAAIAWLERERMMTIHQAQLADQAIQQIQQEIDVLCHYLVTQWRTTIATAIQVASQR